MEMNFYWMAIIIVGMIVTAVQFYNYFPPKERPIVPDSAELIELRMQLKCEKETNTRLLAHYEECREQIRELHAAVISRFKD